MAIPENRKIPSIQVKDLLDPNPRVFGEINALAVLKSPYIEPATAVADFVTSGTKGSPALPVYDSFSIIEASVIDANKFNKYVFYFSCVTEPSVTATPASYVVKTGTILTGLANLNKIEMTVDYNVSGIIKVFMTITQMAGANLDPNPAAPLETAGFNLQFDQDRNYGDEVDPVYHFMTGSLAGAVDGSVATMSHSALVVPEFLVDSGVEAWGTKPAWLTVTGDAYLVGIDNLNQFTFTYNAGAVTAVNVSIASGNIDNERLEATVIVDYNFNENVNPVLANSVQNIGLFADSVTTNINNPAEATYSLVSGVNYALNAGYTSTVFSTRAWMTATIDTYVDRVLTTNHATTIIARLGISLDAGAGNLSAQDRGVFGRRDVDQNGFGMIITGGHQPRVRIGTGDINAETSWTPSGGVGVMNTDNSFYTVGAAFTGGATQQGTIAWKSAANSILYEELTTFSSPNSRVFNSTTNVFQLHKLTDTQTSTGRPTKYDRIKVYAVRITNEELEGQITEIDNV